MESKVSVGFLRNIIYFAASKNASVAELCEAAGIAPELLLKPDEKVAGQLSHKVWLKAEQLTGDSDIGLHLGEQIHPSTLGLVGFVMLSCVNLGDALEKLIRYTNLLTDGVKGKMRQKNRLAEIEVEVASDRENLLLDEPRQRMESSFAAIATVSRILTGKNFPLREVWFAHPRPAKTAEHERIFASTVLFKQRTNKMIFAAEALNYPVLLANRNLLSAFEEQAEQILLELNNQETRSNQVQREIIKKFKGDVPNISDVARELGLSERTLQRELAAEKTTFRDLLDETRRELSFKYLQDKQIPVAEISFLLGFSEPSAFHRSFKRWTKTTPHVFREKLNAE